MKLYGSDYTYFFKSPLFTRCTMSHKHYRKLIRPTIVDQAIPGKICKDAINESVMPSNFKLIGNELDDNTPHTVDGAYAAKPGMKMKSHNKHTTDGALQPNPLWIDMHKLHRRLKAEYR